MSAAMIGLSAELGVQEKSVWCAVYLALTALLDGGDSILGSVVTHGRPELANAEKTLGLFLNSLPIHLSMRGCTWAELILRVDERLQELQRHRFYPLAQIQSELQLDFSASLFNFVNFHVLSDSSDRSNVQGSGGIGLDESNYAFVVDVHKHEASATHLFRLTLDPTVFDAAFQTRIQHYVANILEAMAAGSRSRIDRTRLLGKDLERIRAFNATDVLYPRESAIHELFETQTQRTPRAVAVEAEGEKLTYADLNAKANQLARYLRAQGVATGELVGVCVERGVGMVVGLLGILKAGGAYVPLDPSYPPQRLQYLLEDTVPRAVITQGSVQGYLPPSAARAVCLDTDWAEIAQHRADNHSNAEVALRAEHLAYVIHTSGSTGMPKGVMVEHRNVVYFLSSMRSLLRIGAAGRLLAVTTLSFDIAGLEIYLPLISGSCCVLASRTTASDGTQLIRALEDSSITTMQATPATWRLLRAAHWEGRSDLRALCGGEALPGELAGWLSSRVAELWNMHGPTETTIWSSSWPVAAQSADRRPIESIGAPIANTQIHVLDSAGEPTPIGVSGEIYIGGEGVARGYLRRAALTAERFVADPFSRAGGRLYRTGDQGRWRADGTLEYLDRNDDQVKLRGYRIELGEIESRLGQHPHVQSCVVVTREDEPGDKRLVAYYTGRETAPGVEELSEHLRRQLPDYMVPSAFVLLDQLPQTANGKVNRRGLPAPNAEAYGQMEYEPPHGEIEVALAQIWEELLKVERVGRRDSFFALGGHSLKAVQVVSRVGEVLGQELSVRALFEHVTIQQLATHLGLAARVTAQPIEPADRTQVLPLSWSQERLWFIDQLEGGSEAYHITESARLHGVLDRAALRAALNTILERHEVLRTTFRLEQGQAVQVIGAVNEFALQERDLRGVVVDTEAAVEREASEERNEKFDLSAGPLIRGRLLQLGDEEHVLLLTMHHIVSDGWSIGILLRELGKLYGVYREGVSNPLPALQLQYA